MSKQDLGRLKKVIVLRHGEYGKDWHLTSKGQSQIKAIVEKLKDGIIQPDWQVSVFASPADRTKESAQIIAQHFNVLVQEDQNLFCQSIFEVDYLQKQILHLVLSVKDAYDVVVLVTHMHLGHYFPPYFVKSLLLPVKYKWLSPCGREPWFGEGAVINIIVKVCRNSLNILCLRNQFKPL